MRTYLFVFVFCLAGTLFGQAPASWTVNPNNFSYDMSVTALLNIGGRVSSDGNDKVAAFIDGQVVGVGSPSVNVPSTGQVVVFLTVYSNTASGKTVTFKLYDNVNNTVLDAINSLAFVNNDQVGSNTDPYTIADNFVPTDISLSSSSVSENSGIGITVGNLSTTDQNNTTGFTYTLVVGTGDTDNSFFSINGNQLLTAKDLNYEEDQAKSIRIKTADPSGATYEKFFEISIINENDAPTDITLSNNVLNENNATFAVVGTLTTEDEDAAETFAYSLSGADAASFEVNSEAKLLLKTAADFETKSSYSVTIQVSDQGGSGLTFQKSFTVNINDVNEKPTNISLSATAVNEDESLGYQVATISTTDVDAGDTHQYTFDNGSLDNGTFLIENDKLKLSGTLNYEAKNIHFITLKVTDAGNNTFSKQFEITVNDANETPSDVQLSNYTIAENASTGTLVGVFSTTDVDAGDQFTYELVSGVGSTNNSSFQISGSNLKSNEVFDFETKSSYSIRVKVTDLGSNTFEKVLTVTVTDANDAPTDIILSKDNLYENNLIGDVVATLSSKDQDVSDTYSYAITGSDHDSYFGVNGNQLIMKKVVDFETTSLLDFTVTVTDKGGFGLSFSKKLSMVVNNKNENPTDITLSNNVISENSALNTEIGTFSTTDPDNPMGDTHTYTFTDGSVNNGKFLISGNSLQVAGSIDYETTQIIYVVIVAKDAGLLTYQKQFAINITDVNETPNDIAISSQNVFEDAATGTFVGTLTVNDVDTPDTFTFSLVSGEGSSDNALFEINDDQLLSKGTYDYESDKLLNIRIQAKDGSGNTLSKAFIINVLDANDAPTGINLSKDNVYENNEIDQVFGTLSSVDQDATDTYSYQLTGSDDDAYFKISGNQLLMAKVVDYEAHTSLTFTVKSTDKGGAGYSFSKSFTITVNNVNEAPYNITLSNSTVNENSTTGSTIGTFSVTDDDLAFGDSHTLTFDNGNATSGSFLLDGMTLKVAGVLNFEVEPIKFIKIVATDKANNTYSKQFQINVIDVNEKPGDIYLDISSLDENSAANTIVSQIYTTDVDASDSFEYSLVAGVGDKDNASFAIDGDDLVALSAFDYETKSEYSIRLQVKDAGGNIFSKSLKILVNDVNDAPTNITLSSSKVIENNAPTYVIGTLTTSDVDQNEEFQYTLSGGADMSAFDIANVNELILLGSSNYELKNSYEVQIKSTDKKGNGLSFTKSFTIQILDANDSPTDIQLSNAVIAENSAANTEIGKFTVTDEDLSAGDKFIYSFANGEFSDNTFYFDGDLLKVSGALDFEKKPIYFITAKVTDSGNKSFEKQFKITISDVNEKPTDIYLSNNSIFENESIGTLIGLLTEEDEDGNDTFSYSLVAGNGDSDNSKFSISGSSLVSAVSFDFETKNTYSVRIAVTDAAGNVFSKSFVIQIKDVNEPPTGLSIDNVEILENEGPTLIGTFTTDDIDVGDSFTYEITGNDAVQLKKLFGIEDNQLFSKVPFDAEGQAQYSVPVTVTDNAGGQFTQQFVILVISVNEAPEISDFSFTIEENTAYGTAVGSLVGSDVDFNDELSYDFAIDDPFYDFNSAAFGIDSSTGLVFVNVSDSLNYEEWKERIYTVRVTDKDGLSATAMLRIVLTDVVEVGVLPVNEVITPNGDGFNDVFEIRNIDLYQNFTLIIYNANGLEVYRKANYTNEWNGVSNSGKNLDAGAYYFKFTNGDFLYKGTVTIIRN